MFRGVALLMLGAFSMFGIVNSASAEEPAPVPTVGVEILPGFDGQSPVKQPTGSPVVSAEPSPTPSVQITRPIEIVKDVQVGTPNDQNNSTTRPTPVVQAPSIGGESSEADTNTTIVRPTPRPVGSQSASSSSNQRSDVTPPTTKEPVLPESAEVEQLLDTPAQNGPSRLWGIAGLAVLGALAALTMFRVARN